MSLDKNSKLSDIIAILQECEGINQKEELKNILTNIGMSVSDNASMADMIILLNESDFNLSDVVQRLQNIVGGLNEMSELSSVLNEKNIETSTDDSLEDLILKVKDIKQPTGNAEPDDVIQGKIFSNKDNIDLIGTATIQSIVNNDPSQLNNILNNVNININEEMINYKDLSLDIYDYSIFVNKKGYVLFANHQYLILFDNNYNKLFKISIDGKNIELNNITYLQNGCSYNNYCILTNDNIFIIDTSYNIVKYDFQGNKIYTQSTSGKAQYGFAYYNKTLYYVYNYKDDVNDVYGSANVYYFGDDISNSSQLLETRINFANNTIYMFMSSVHPYILMYGSNGSNGGTPHISYNGLTTFAEMLSGYPSVPSPVGEINNGVFLFTIGNINVFNESVIFGIGNGAILGNTFIINDNLYCFSSNNKCLIITRINNQSNISCNIINSIITSKMVVNPINGDIISNGSVYKINKTTQIYN